VRQAEPRSKLRGLVANVEPVEPTETCAIDFQAICVAVNLGDHQVPRFRGALVEFLILSDSLHMRREGEVLGEGLRSEGKEA
jgi:hypothetical protein